MTGFPLGPGFCLKSRVMAFMHQKYGKDIIIYILAFFQTRLT
jgi:hypothetical protein